MLIDLGLEITEKINKNPKYMKLYFELNEVIYKLEELTDTSYREFFISKFTGQLHN